MSNNKTKKHYNVRKKSKKNSKKKSRYSLKKRKISKLKGGANASAAVKSLCEIIDEHEKSIVNINSPPVSSRSSQSSEGGLPSAPPSPAESPTASPAASAPASPSSAQPPPSQLPAPAAASTKIVVRGPSPPQSPSTLKRTRSLSQTASTKNDPHSAYITVEARETKLETEPLVTQDRPSSSLLTNIRPGIKPGTAKFRFSKSLKNPASAPIVSKQTNTEKLKEIDAKYKPHFEKLKEDYETIDLMLNEQLEELKKNLDEINDSTDTYIVKMEKTKKVNEDIKNKNDEIKTNKTTYDTDKYELQQKKAKEENNVTYIHPYQGAKSVLQKRLTVTDIQSQLGIGSNNSGSEWSENEN
jgi:hypothetical protein